MNRGQTAPNRRVQIRFRLGPEAASRALPAPGAAWNCAAGASSICSKDVPGPTDRRGSTPFWKLHEPVPGGKPLPKPATASPCPYNSAEYSGLNNHNIFEQKIPFHFNDPILQKNKWAQKG